MFAFFINGAFFDFWANKEGDIFVDATLNTLNIDAQAVELFFYPNIPIARPEYFIFDQDKNLVIQNKISSIENGIEVEEMVTTNTVAPITYISNGQKVKPC